MSIGKLKEIDVRELWKHEQYDFSEWLSKQSNISYLDDILGLTLTDVDREVYVGPYRCDLVAKDETAAVKVNHYWQFFAAVIGIPDVRKAVGIGFTVFNVVATNQAVFQLLHFRRIPRLPLVGLMPFVELCVDRFLQQPAFQVIDEFPHSNPPDFVPLMILFYINMTVLSFGFLR